MIQGVTFNYRIPTWLILLPFQNQTQANIGVHLRQVLEMDMRGEVPEQKCGVSHVKCGHLAYVMHKKKAIRIPTRFLLV